MSTVPSALRRIVERLGPDLVLCDFRVIRERPRLKHALRGERHRRSFSGPARRLDRDRARLMRGWMRDGLMHVWTKIGRRALWQCARFPPRLRVMEEAAVIPMLADAARSYYYEPVPWIGYRQHSDSALATLDIAGLSDMLEAIRAFNRAVEGLQWLDAGTGEAVARCRLRMFASVARRMRRVSPERMRSLARARGEIFPQGTGAVMARLLRSREWWRWFRIRRALAAIERPPARAGQGARFGSPSSRPTMLSRK